MVGRLGITMQWANHRRLERLVIEGKDLEPNMLDSSP